MCWPTSRSLTYSVKNKTTTDESLLTRCRPSAISDYECDNDENQHQDHQLVDQQAVTTGDEPARLLSPVSPSPSSTTSTTTTTTSINSATTTNASQTPVIVCRQADAEVSSSPSSPTNSYGRLPFSRPIKNPSELDKKVRVQSSNLQPVRAILPRINSAQQYKLIIFYQRIN